MVRSLLAVIVVVGCGPATPARPASSTAAAVAPAGVPTPEQLCTRARELRDAGCSPYSRVPDQLFETCSVVDGIYIGGAQDCVFRSSCDEIARCAVNARRTGAPYRGPTAACEADVRPTIPVGVSAAELEASYGRTAKRYSDAPSSAVKPIEVCGIPAQSVYLLRVTCNDGSRPFADSDEVAGARIGNVGEAGRCGRIVDEYEVPCPEESYRVFIDPYRCPAAP
jgi:hypothetical protein